MAFEDITGARLYSLDIAVYIYLHTRHGRFQHNEKQNPAIYRTTAVQGGGLVGRWMKRKLAWPHAARAILRIMGVEAETVPDGWEKYTATAGGSKFSFALGSGFTLALGAARVLPDYISPVLLPWPRAGYGPRVTFQMVFYIQVPTTS